MTSAGPVPRRRAGPRVARRTAARGFTLLELMATMVLVGMMLLLLPPSLDSMGDRNRLESAANSLVAAFTGLRETAVIDGHEAHLQILLPGTTADRKATGKFRTLVTARERQRAKAFRDAEEPGVREAPVDRDRLEPEEAWIFSQWRPLPDGVVIEGFSVTSGEWLRSNPRGEPVEVTFHPDGSVRPVCAIRLVNVDLPSRASRTLTVMVNALTAVAYIVEGEAELPRSRDPSDFP